MDDRNQRWLWTYEPRLFLLPRRFDSRWETSLCALLLHPDGRWWNIVCRWIFILQVQNGGCIPPRRVPWKASCKDNPCEGPLSACSQARRRRSYCEHITRLQTTSSFLCPLLRVHRSGIPRHGTVLISRTLLQVHEFEITKTQAEKVLSENGGDIIKSLGALVAAPTTPPPQAS